MRSRQLIGGKWWPLVRLATRCEETPGEYEKLEQFRDVEVDGGVWREKVTCDDPISVEARSKNVLSSNIPFFTLLRPSYGWACKTADHPEGYCDDVEVRFCCANVGSQVEEEEEEEEEETNGEEETTTSPNVEIQRPTLSAGECPESRTWTAWLSRDSGASGSGEYEQLHHHEGVCSDPPAVEVRKVDQGDGSAIKYYDMLRPFTEEAGEKGWALGYYCKNDNHPDGVCDDVEIRFCC